MQKITSYIYENRIPVVGDTGQLITEWRIVYQRVIKIYQGLDNVIEFDFKNGQQRRIDVSQLNIQCVVMDQLNEEVCTVSVIPTIVIGLAHCTIPAIELANITPQLLKYTLYQINPNGTKTPIYGDVNYGAVGKMELIGGALPQSLAPLIIDTFLYTIDDDSTTIIKTYFSESAEINAPNDFVTSPIINVEFRFDNLDADVWVQVTDYAVISTGTIWYDVEHFTVAPTTSKLYKVYDNLLDYSNNIGWMRIKYVPKNDSIGSLKKVIIRL